MDSQKRFLTILEKRNPPMFRKIRMINKYKIPFMFSISDIVQGIIRPEETVELEDINIGDNDFRDITFEVATDNIDSKTAGEIAMAALEGSQYKPWVEVITDNYIYVYDKRQFTKFPVESASRR